MISLSLSSLTHRLKALSDFGDPLERLSGVVDFEIFRSPLESGFNFSQRERGGRPPYDAVLMFKILILQTLYNLSDDQTEYQIKDRLSFMRFLRLALSDHVPDAKTIWLYRERLKKAEMIEGLFRLFDQSLREKGYLAMGGQIVDASVIQAPRQRMTQNEKEQIKAGDIPQDWKEKPAKLSQKDCDARWIIKQRKSKGKGLDIAIPLFGYKTHLSIDRRFNFVRRYHVTVASSYDGKLLDRILSPENTAKDVWGDTAYHHQQNEVLIEREGLRSQLHHKKPHRRPMTKQTRRANRQKSGIRAKVEHVFAVQKERMNLFIRTIGIKRAAVKIAMANLVYNFNKLIFWEKHFKTTG